MNETTNETREIANTESKTPIAIGLGGIQIASIEDLYRFAKYVVASGFAPKGMERPESILIAVEMGLEIGLKPMAALQNIAVINGRPSVWGDAALALVMGNPLCEYVFECFEGRPFDDEFKAKFEAKRKGRDSIIQSEFSVADAKLAGLWKKAGPWTQYPKRMLQCRARAFGLRDGFPDVLKGVYVAEFDSSMRDVVTLGVEDVEVEAVPKKAKPKTMDELKVAMKAEDEAATAPTPKLDKPKRTPKDKPEPIVEDVATGEEKDLF